MESNADQPRRGEVDHELSCDMKANSRPAVDCRPFRGSRPTHSSRTRGLRPLAIECRPFGAVAFGCRYNVGPRCARGRILRRRSRGVRSWFLAAGDGEDLLEDFAADVVDGAAGEDLPALMSMSSIIRSYIGVLLAI